ncbi:hypothetical protein SBA2_170002 [Acidobacteriia bacterium SbA2]|nr:hypothetical protein SBA2_170002 [Acidobacteriia bacterium SbA2]
MSLTRIGLVGAVREPLLLEGRVITAKAGIQLVPGSTMGLRLRGDDDADFHCLGCAAGP